MGTQVNSAFGNSGIGSCRQRTSTAQPMQQRPFAPGGQPGGQMVQGLDEIHHVLIRSSNLQHDSPLAWRGQERCQRKFIGDTIRLVNPGQPTGG